MRRLLPSWNEVVVFALLAIVCAVIVGAFHTSTSDLRFAALAGPIFLVAAVMGLRKSPVWTMEIEKEDFED